MASDIGEIKEIKTRKQRESSHPQNILKLEIWLGYHLVDLSLDRCAEFYLKYKKLDSVAILLADKTCFLIMFVRQFVPHLRDGFKSIVVALQLIL